MKMYLGILCKEKVPASPTFSGVFVVDRKLEIRSITQSTLADNLSLEFENRYTSTIEGNPRGFFLGLEFEMNGR